jgi:hypothetical protein
MGRLLFSPYTFAMVKAADHASSYPGFGLLPSYAWIFDPPIWMKIVSRRDV